MTPFKALLIEGTSGVGKSTLIDALIRRHVNSSTQRKIRSLIHLAQSHTYGPLASPAAGRSRLQIALSARLASHNLGAGNRRPYR
jgi:GTPase SAR1 family protein